MKGRIIKVTVIFSLLLAAVTGILALNSRKSVKQDERSEELLDLNEISQLIEQGDYDMAKSRAYMAQKALRKAGLLEEETT